MTDVAFLAVASEKAALLAAVFLTAGILGGAGCAAEIATPDLTYEERAQTATQARLTVATSALSAEESTAVYGVPLAEKDIQPLWIVIENHDDVPYWLMFPGVDPNFFPASEAAEAMVVDRDARARAEFESRFRERGRSGPAVGPAVDRR